MRSIMSGKAALRKGITEQEFINGYWYATEIKAFAKEIGIPNSSRLRKDELEQLIQHYIRTGKIKSAARKNILKTGRKDLDLGLKASLPIIHYTSNRQTKDFIKSEAGKLAPKLKIKTGVWYRLNRWRDEQITAGRKITYGDLVKQFVHLNEIDTEFEKIAVGRYINFLSDFSANEPGATRAKALHAWKQLKKLDIPKDYRSWKASQKSHDQKRFGSGKPLP